MLRTPDNFRASWLFVTLFPLFLIACAPDELEYHQESFVFGTRVEITIHGEDKSKAQLAVKDILQRFDQLHRKFHAWQPSDLDRLNTAFSLSSKKTAADPELLWILKEAKDFSQQSDGLFEPAIGNLIKLWGFHSDTPPSALPSKSAITQQIIAKPSMRDVHSENGQAWSSNPAVRIDLGGYVKGYALDEAVKILKGAGVNNALVNIGGNVIALGKHGNRAWKVGIQHPREAGVIATLDLLDGEAIGTSGDYQRYFEIEGERYCHLIDPRTGQPASEMQSVTLLVSGDRAGVESDVLTKPLFIGGLNRLGHWLSRFNLNQAMVIDSNGNVQVSDGMLRRLEWREPEQTYQLLAIPPVR